jgi:hypothetical protein
MITEPTEVNPQTNQMNTSGQDKTYITAKLRGAAVMYGPAVALDLFEGISVLVAAFGKLPDPRRSTAARFLRPITTVGALAAQVMNPLPPSRTKKRLWLAFVLGFFFSGIALGIFFRTWVDLVVPTVIWLALIVTPGDAGFWLGAVIGDYGVC